MNVLIVTQIVLNVKAHLRIVQNAPAILNLIKEQTRVLLNVKKEKLCWFHLTMESLINAFLALLTVLLVQQQQPFVPLVLLHKFYDLISLAIRPVKSKMKWQSTNNASRVINDVLLVVALLIRAQHVLLGIICLNQLVLQNVLRNIKLLKKIKSAFSQDLCVQMTITTVKIEKVVYLQKGLVIKKDMF